MPSAALIVWSCGDVLFTNVFMRTEPPIKYHGNMNCMDLMPKLGDTIVGGASKNKILFIVVGAVLIGILIGAVALSFFFRDAVFLNIPTTNNGILSYPIDQKVPDLKTNILLPKKLVNEDYYLLINKIVNELNQVGTNNNTILLPLMNAIKQKSVTKDFSSLFDLIIQARNEVKKNNDILATAKKDIADFKKVNDETTSDADVRNQTTLFSASGNAFIREFSDYFALINETLSGSVPTQELLNKLAEKVVSLRSAGSSFQSELDALLTLMKQKIQTDTP